MNIYEFNKVIYKGSINRNFYIYCLKKNIELIKYIFINLYNIILSIIFKNKGDIYTRNKFKYLKEIKNLEEELEQFYKRKNKYRYSILYENKIDIIIDKIPIIFFQKNLTSKIIGYELDENYNVNIEKYKEEVSKINTAQRLYIRNRYHLLNIKSKEIFIVNNNLIHFINKRKQLNKKAINSLIIILISLLLTIISFCYTNKSLDITMYNSYFELKLFILNFTPIFLMNELFDYCNLSGSEYLNYMSDLKAKIYVISEYYYKEDGEFIKKEQSKYKDLVKEYNYVNYYYSRNFKK